MPYYCVSRAVILTRGQFCLQGTVVNIWRYFWCPWLDRVVLEFTGGGRAEVLLLANNAEDSRHNRQGLSLQCHWCLGLKLCPQVRERSGRQTHGGKPTILEPETCSFWNILHHPTSRMHLLLLVFKTLEVYVPHISINELGKAQF